MPTITHHLLHSVGLKQSLSLPIRVIRVCLKTGHPKSHDLKAHVTHWHRVWCITEYPHPFCPVALRHRELLPHHQTPARQKLVGFLAVPVKLGYGPILSARFRWIIQQIVTGPSIESVLPSSHHGRHHQPRLGKKNPPHHLPSPAGRPPWLHQSCYAAAAGSVEAVPPLRAPSETPRRQAPQGSSKSKNEKRMKKETEHLIYL